MFGGLCGQGLLFHLLFLPESIAIQGHILKNKFQYTKTSLQKQMIEGKKV